MKGDTRCVDGRLMRHDPQPDDPDLETDRGVCPDCNGAGCAEMCEECGEYPADLPSKLCVGCDAYRDHTGHY